MPYTRATWIVNGWWASVLFGPLRTHLDGHRRDCPPLLICIYFLWHSFIFSVAFLSQLSPLGHFQLHVLNNQFFEALSCWARKGGGGGGGGWRGESPPFPTSLTPGWAAGSRVVITSERAKGHRDRHGLSDNAAANTDNKCRNMSV